MREIESIKLLYPSLMSDTALDEIRASLVEKEEAESQVSKLFMEEERLRNRVKEIDEFLRKVSGLYIVEYKKIVPEKKEFEGGIEAPMIVESTGIIHV